MPWTCDPDFNDTLDVDLNREGWVYATLTDRSDLLGQGEIQLGRYPAADEVDDDPLDERKERVMAWLRGRLHERLALADRKTVVKFRVRAYGGKGLASVVSRSYTARFDGEATAPKAETPLANEARELVDVMLNGMRGMVGTASSLMGQMGQQLLDERRQHADLQKAVAAVVGADQDRESRNAMATNFFKTVDGGVKLFIAEKSHPVLANPKVRALLERPDVQAALADEQTLGNLIQAVEMMASARQASARPSWSPPALPAPPTSDAVRALEAELAKDSNLGILLNTPEGTDALVTSLRQMAGDKQENDDEPVPA